MNRTPLKTLASVLCLTVALSVASVVDAHAVTLTTLQTPVDVGIGGSGGSTTDGRDAFCAYFPWFPGCDR